MNKDSYVKAMESLQTPRGMEKRILRACEAKVPQRRSWAKRAVALTAAFALVMGAVLGVPYITGNQQTGQPEVKMSTGLSLQVRAAGNAGEIYFPITGTSEPVEKEFIIFDENDLFSGGSGLDFYVKGEEVSSVDYRTELGDLMCEFESQHQGENGEYIWTQFSAGMDTDEYLPLVSDPENPTKEELIAVANYLDGEGRLSYLREQMNLGEDDPIDYDKVNLEGEILTKGESTATFIRFANPEKVHIPSVQDAKELQGVYPTDWVTWHFPTEIFNENIQKSRDEVDFSGYQEKIQIVVHYTDGRDEAFSVNMSFNKEGVGTTTITRETAA